MITKNHYHLISIRTLLFVASLSEVALSLLQQSCDKFLSTSIYSNIRHLCFTELSGLYMHYHKFKILEQSQIKFKS